MPDLTSAHRLSAWDALSHRNFLLLSTGQLLSALGDGVAVVAVSFALLEATGSLSALGWVLGARYVTLGGLLLLGGVLGDRGSRCRILVVSDVTRAVVQGATAALLLFGHADVLALVALQAAYGAAEAFFGPAMRGVVPETVPREHLRAANTIGEVTFNVSRILGPALGGLLVIVAGAGGAIALDASTFLVSAVLVSRMTVGRTPTEPVSAAHTRPGFWSELAAGWTAVRSRRWLLTSLVTFSLFGGLTVPAVWVLGPAASWRGLGGVTGWSAMTSAFGAGALVGSFLALNLAVRRPGPFLIVTLVLWGLRPATFVAGWSLPAVAAYSFLAGAAMALAGVVWYTLLQTTLPQSQLSRVGAIDDFGTYLLTPVGYFCAAPFAAAVGLQPALLLLAGVPVAMALAALAVPELRRLDGSGTDPGPSVSLAQGEPAPDLAAASRAG